MDLSKAMLFILLSFFHTIDVSAQSQYIRCGKDELRFENGNWSHFSLVVLTPYKECRLSAFPKYILDSNTIYLMGRVGNDFVSEKAVLDKSYLIDFKDTSIHVNAAWLMKADKRVRYAFQYYFRIGKRMRYYFTNVFDSAGNRLSADMLPNINGNKKFHNLISICKAKEIAEGSYSGKVFTATVAYADTLNCFVWEMQYQSEKTNVKDVYLDKTVFINANTGIVVKLLEKDRLQTCQPPPFPNLRRD